MQADHRATLGADQIIHGDTDRPAVARSLANNLIRRVNIPGPSDPGRLFHFLPGLEHLHTDGCGAKAQQQIQFGNQCGAVEYVVGGNE